MANKIGNFSGIALVIFSATMANTGGDVQIWERDWRFFLGVSTPCLLGLVIANVVTSCLSMKKPERITVSIECCYQNVGIATSVALTMFQGDDLSEAMAVPLLYGLVEAVILGIYCVGAWKMGWTKAPPTTPFWTMIFRSYEVLEADWKSPDNDDEIEITMSTSMEDRIENNQLDQSDAYRTF
eukprot:scaffold135161_cov49-Attheya_sp.AAC.2